jgi:pimeloyl-ACP methyl ester carboxylesterase
MSDIAGHLARAIDHDLGGPVALHGTSTGGSVALQLAVDRPDLVGHLVVVASACRLGPGGRALQAEMARLIRSGRTRQALSHLVSCLQPPRLRGLLRPVSWMAGRWMTPRDPSDLLVTLEAEDVFDVEADLRAISAPTLVIGGSEDVFYGRQLFERTAAGVQDGRLHVFEGWGHGRTSASSATARLALAFLREEHA